MGQGLRPSLRCGPPARLTIRVPIIKDSAGEAEALVRELERGGLPRLGTAFWIGDYSGTEHTFLYPPTLTASLSMAVVGITAKGGLNAAVSVSPRRLSFSFK